MALHRFEVWNGSESETSAANSFPSHLSFDFSLILRLARPTRRMRSARALRSSGESVFFTPLASRPRAFAFLFTTKEIALLSETCKRKVKSYEQTTIQKAQVRPRYAATRLRPPAIGDPVRDQAHPKHGAIAMTFWIGFVTGFIVAALLFSALGCAQRGDPISKITVEDITP